jgi:hypothetical protein
MNKPCENCGCEEEVENTELGDLCPTCYSVLSQEHLNLFDNGDEDV